MTAQFGHAYADAYDLIYADKDYEAECDLLERVFGESGHKVSSVLDLGCGTGAHAVRLAQRGYEVVGVDVSADMLRRARDRAAGEGAPGVRFAEGDVRSIRLGRSFDAVICMFAVLGYQTSDQDVADTLRTIRAHLAVDGPLAFDVWYGPAVEAVGPERRVKVIPTPHGELERQAEARLSPDVHLCTVSYRLTVRSEGQPDRVAEEEHRMRYFFEDELSQSLAAEGMSLVDLRPFPGLEGTPDESSWNVFAVARG